jgi:hypothetical protein
VATYAVFRAGEVRLKGRILDVSGSRMLEGNVTTPVMGRKKTDKKIESEKTADKKTADKKAADEISAARGAGVRLAGELLERGAGELLAEWEGG